MIWSQLPPVGTPFPPLSSDYSLSPLQFVGFDYIAVNSGTAALGQILSWVGEQLPVDTHFKVVVPGYGCPDLVAACHFANATPVLIDLEQDRYQFNLAQLREIADDIQAVICPALFGLSMDLAAIREITGEQVRLIEDNAQWFPEVRCDRNIATVYNYTLPHNTHQADFFITSLGRGKPVNMLGGGLLAWNQARIDGFLTNLPHQEDNARITAIKGRLFNTICHPVAYGALTRMPGINLGATEYHALERVELMAPGKQQGIASAVLAYLRQNNKAQTSLQEAVPVLWGKQAQDKRLLRLPLIAQTPASRENLLRTLNEAGLGASPMYGKALKDIDGVTGKCETPFAMPVSQNLADCLLTLPVHKGVKPRHVRRMIHILDTHRQWLGERPQAETSQL